MIEIVRPGTNFDFVGKRKIFMWISVVAIAATFVGLATPGLRYGIDFTGGAEIQVKIPNTWDIGRFRETLVAAGFEEAKVVQLGAVEEGVFLIKAQGSEAELTKISNELQSKLEASALGKDFEIQRADVVGPAAGETLRNSGFLSMLYALVSILIYVTIRFDSRYSPGAVLALFHDTVITLGVYVLTQKQFDLQILAAILAMIGYSNNDTIIVYDRVRETLENFPKLSIEEAVNRSINETLGRTILTALSTLLSVLALWLLGGKVIENFAFTFIVGIIVGTYSSIFIASSLVIWFTKRAQKQAHSGKGSKSSWANRSSKRPSTA